VRDAVLGARQGMQTIRFCSLPSSTMSLSLRRGDFVQGCATLIASSSAHRVRTSVCASIARELYMTMAKRSLSTTNSKGLVDPLGNQRRCLEENYENSEQNGWCGWSTWQALCLFGMSAGVMLLVVGGDAYFGWSRPQQHCASLATWVCLGGLLKTFVIPYDRLVAAQCGIVVAYGTITEYFFSEWLDVYTYRLGTLPMFIPPYHGILFLGELSLATALMIATASTPHIRSAVFLTCFGFAGAVAVRDAGLLPCSNKASSTEEASSIPSPPDNMGLFWYICLLSFGLLSGRWNSNGWMRSLTSRQMAWACALLIVTPIEHYGSSIGTWRWREVGLNQVPSLLCLDFTSQNPPSGVAGGYAWFNLVAIAVAPVCMRFPKMAAALWGSAVGAAIVNAQRVERPVMSRYGFSLMEFHKATNIGVVSKE